MIVACSLALALLGPAPTDPAPAPKDPPPAPEGPGGATESGAGPPRPGIRVPSQGASEGASKGAARKGPGPETGFLDPFSPPPSRGDTEPLTEEQRRALQMERFEAHMVQARAAAREQRWEEAISAYSRALELLPGDPDALAGRAHARRARIPAGKCPRRAIGDLLLLSTYDPRGRWPAERASALEWMGACGELYAKDRLQLARELAQEDPDSPSRPRHVRLLLAELLLAEADRSRRGQDRRALQREALTELERYRDEMQRRRKKPRPRALRLLADTYRLFGQLEAAIEAYRAWGKTRSGEARAEADRLVSELEDEKTLLEWEEIYGGRPTPEGAQAYAEGVAAYERGDLAAAQAAFDRVIEISEWYPKAWYMRGLLHARSGRFARAVEDLARATRLDRTFFEAYLKLGMIYKDEFAGTRDDEAREALEAALRLRPDLYPLHLLLGELYARVDREVARGHYQRFLESAPMDDPDAVRARRALDELDRTIREDAPQWVSPPPEESLRFVDPALQRLINEAYLKVQQGNWDRAESILREAHARFPQEPVVVNQLARVMYARKRYGEARTYWEQSLEMDPDQVLVHEQLGMLLMDDLPAEAQSHLRAAAEAGSVRARFVLAQLLWDEGGLFEAGEQLDRYLADADKYDLYWQRAQGLRAEIRRRMVYMGLGAGALVLVGVGVPAVRVYRRVRGVSLAQFLARHPKSFPEVARILSLVRHEILKHNTAFLADVGRALELGEDGVEERAAVLARRMFGEDGPARAGHRGPQPGSGIHGRFLGYVDELDQVARSYGERLNLRRKDPTFRPMLEAFEDLAQMAGELRAVPALRHSRKLELARRLRRAGRVLGRQAFERLSGLIQALCVVQVDADLVRGVYEQVLGEEHFAGVAWAPFEVTGQGARVRIFRTDLEDILANVLRNSLRSTLEHASPPLGLAVELVTEEDEITGLCTLAIRIKDRSPEKLSDEMLRGRYVERGMGITVDLLSRYDGAIGVEPEPGWEKAVVLRLFTLEPDDESLEEAPPRLVSSSALRKAAS